MKLFSHHQLHRLSALLLLFPFAHLSAQQTDLSLAHTPGKFTYIYRISNERMINYYRHDQEPIPLDVTESPVDSFYTDSMYKRILPPGNYVYAFGSENEIHYTLNVTHDFEVKLIDDSRALSVGVYKKDGRVVNDAEVRVEKKTIHFDSSCQCYSDHKSSRHGLLTVQSQEQLAVFTISRAANNSWYLRPLKRFYYWLPIDNIIFGIRNEGNPFAYLGNKYRREWNPTYNGYVVTNQPKYRIGDTVKIKAFLLDKNKKPLRKKLLLTITEGYASKNIVRDTVTPSSRGDFIYQFVVGDSVTTFKDYEISFTSLDEKLEAVSASFRVEDYQLDETFYKVNFVRQNFINTEPISFSISSHDANGLSLLDSKVEILILPVSYHEPYLPVQYVKDTLWRFTGMLDQDGQTEFIVADSVLPRADMNLTAQFFFTNANNEIKDTTISISIDKPEKIVELKMENENVTAQLIENGISVHGKAELTELNGSTILTNREIELPFTEKINALVTNYGVEFEGKIFWLDASKEQSEVTSTAFRTEDSVYVILKNPRKLPVSYSVFKGSNEAEHGTFQNDFTWKKEDHSKSSWHFIFRYFWHGESMHDFVTAVLYDKRLNVEIYQPGDIFPGEETSVKIKITDFRGNPVPHVNLTAASVNGQFEKFEVPPLPNFSKIRGRVMYYNQFEIENVKKEFTCYMSEDWLHRFHLDTSLFYQFLYPKKAVTIYNDSLNIDNAQFSVYSCNAGFDSQVLMIYANNHLVFFSGTEAQHPYSLIIEPGKYELRIRTYREEFITDSITFRKGFKTEIVINPFLADTGRNILIRRRKPKFSEDELTALKQSLFFFNVVGSHYGTLFVRSAGNISRVSGYLGGRNVFYSAGPFNSADPVEVIVPGNYKRTIIFHPQMNCLIDATNSMWKEQNAFVYSIKTSLYVFNGRHEFGELAITDSDLLARKYSQYRLKPFLASQPGTNAAGNGSLGLTNRTDSIFYALILMRSDHPEQEFILDATLGTYYDLLPGYYSIKLFTVSGNFVEMDSVLIKPAQMRWQVIKQVKFFPRDTSSKEWKNIFLPEVFHTFFRKYRFGNCELQGRVFDEKSNEGIPFALVVITLKGEQIASGQTDDDGNYLIENVAEGNYDVRVQYLGYESSMITHAQLVSGRIMFLNIPLRPATLELQDVMVVGDPLIEADKTSTGSMRIPYSANESVNYIACMTAGVSQSTDLESLNIAGARENVTKYVIDGIQLSGGIPASYGDVAGGAISVDDELPQNQNSIREKFFDCAYWQPNLFTNDSGSVSFKVKFPDNITKWNSYALAMNDKKMCGAGYTFSRSWKKLSATLELPRFMVEGDSSEAIGKVMNYTGKKVRASTNFELDGKQISSLDTSLSEFFFERFPFAAAGKDSVQWTYSVHVRNYFDGEKKKIPVLPQGIEQSRGNFYVLNHDTLIHYSASVPDQPVFITARENLVDVFRDDLDYLKKYPYQCNEQLASKLIGAVLAQQLNDPKHPNTLSSYAKRLEDKLFRNQNDDGSWGWWGDLRANAWMTCYVLHALYVANGVHYDPHLYHGINFLRDNLIFMSSNQLTDALQVLKEFKEQLDYDFYLKRIKPDSADVYAQMKFMLLKKENGNQIDLDKLFSKKHETIFGSTYWGNDEQNWYDNSMQLTILAYKILRLDSSQRNYLPLIRSYFLEQKNKNVNWRNTIETALTLETILPDLLNESHGVITPVSMKINNELTDISANRISNRKYFAKEIIITKSGSSPVYLTCYQNFFERNPEPKEENFSIKTFFVSDRRITDTLTAGKYAELHVNLIVKKKSEYVMLSVPVPAGCSYGDKTPNHAYAESHREYLKDKTIIFCESLNPGHYEFTVQLEPRFKGVYTINPAQARLMYFPVLDGNNVGRKVVIR